MAASRDNLFSSAEEWQTESEATGDDDMDFELASDEMTTDESNYEPEEDETDDGGEVTLYFDAEDGTLHATDGDEVIATEEDEELNDTTEGGEGSHTPRPAASSRPTQTIALTQQQILQLLSHAGIRGLFQSGGITTRSQARRRQREEDGEEEEVDDDDDDDDDEPYIGHNARRIRQSRLAFKGDRYPKIPSEEGKKLMASGTFGTSDRCDHSACGHPLGEDVQRKRRNLGRRMLDRELGVSNRGRQRVLNSLASQDMIPGSKADMIINLNARCYSGQFSEDGSFFFACGQDFVVRMYDTSNPYHWKFYKDARYYGGQWTITDASLSPDNKLLAYSSIRSQVCLSNTDKDRSEPQMLDFADLEGHSRRGHHYRGHFGIWSIRFSGDGKEIVAGTSDNSVYVYDLEARKSILKIPGHTDDVNAVCFGDKMSPHILYSGSDDTTLKVWDRRSLSSLRPAGMFLGHTEGLTYIDSKGDGRYVISNGKDQTCKLWDLRKMISTDEGERIRPEEYTTNFDYRFTSYSVDSHVPHKHDCSLVTFRGHRVLKTLIRCHFSPAGSTDGSYIYSGSHDGKIYIWNLDGTQASPPINVLAATKHSRPRSDRKYAERYDYYEDDDNEGRSWKTIVRDCSWHPSAPVIAATSWNGWDHGLGTCTVHSWNGGTRGNASTKASCQSGGDDGFLGDEEDLDLRNGSAYASVKENWGSAPMGARVSAQLRHDDRYYQAETTPRWAAAGLRNRLGRGIGAFWGEELYDDDGE